MAQGMGNAGVDLTRLDAESGIDYARVEQMNESIDFDTLENYEFGGKLASQIGANLSDEHDGTPRRADVREAQTRMEQAARPQDWKGKLAGMTHEEQVQATLDCLGRKNNQKEILYDLLLFCQEERAEEEAYAFLEAHKQFADGYHTASKYLLFMQRTGAIQELEYAQDGTLVTDEMRQAALASGATEDEAAELAVRWSYRTTPVGMDAIAAFDPAKRTEQLLATQKSSRLASYRRLLEYCSEPRSLAQIVAFMDGDPGLEVDPRTGVMHMQPSAYIGLLDQAGALTWNDGWVCTEGGMRALQNSNLI